MMKLDEDALLCDLAETYQIYDFKQLPLSKVAVFSYGLRDDSRIKMRMNEQNVTLDNLLLAGINDALNLLVWFKTKDGQKGNNKPELITSKLVGIAEKTSDNEVFVSGQDFEETRLKLIENIGGGS